jgi:hypothetical protein
MPVFWNRGGISDLLPGSFVGDLQVEARGHVEIPHEAGRDEVFATQVVIDARPAVAAEIARRELAFVGFDQILTAGADEVLLGDHDAGEMGARPPLAAGAMAVAHRLRVLDLVGHSATEARAFERVGHRKPSS